ncbi:WD repeat and SOCS box-containing protein 2 isoform 3-T3 [Amazona ochrocephala]
MKPVGEEPVLLAELKPGRPQRYDWKSSCETWSVAFSPDGAWFAWSQGHCVVKLIPWPLREPELSCKAPERKSRSSKAEARSRAVAKEKTLECGQIVWGLAFSAWPAAEEGDTDPACTVGLPCLILATGLNDGQIKVWEVQTGHLLFSLLGHEDVVRDLSFAPNGSLILVSASRDKTLRVWDLSRDGRQVQVLSGHVQWVYCCSISPDCSMLCSAAGEKSAPEDLGIGPALSGCICSHDQRPVLHVLPTRRFHCHRDQGWPRPVLDCSKGPLIAEALVPQGSAHLPHNVPGPGAPHSQEAEGVPHLPDLLKQGAVWMHGGESPLPGGRAWPGLEEAPHNDVSLMPEPWGRIAAALHLGLPWGAWRWFLV